MAKPLVAIVGRPNVGKSMLNNGQSFQHGIRTGTPMCLYIAYLHIYSVVK